MLFAATMSTVGSGESNNQNQSPEFSALASRIFVVAVSFSHSLVSNVFRWAFLPFIFLYPAISCLVSPLIVFATLVAKLSLITPLATTCYLLKTLHPVYVFCGVACITGIVIGMGGRALSTFLTRTFSKMEEHGTTRTHVPMARGNERRSRRRRLRTREEDTQSTCEALVAICGHYDTYSMFTLGFV